jgi:hypothetical protein
MLSLRGPVHLMQTLVKLRRQHGVVSQWVLYVAGHILPTYHALHHPHCQGPLANPVNSTRINKFPEESQDYFRMLSKTPYCHLQICAPCTPYD